MSKTRKWSEVKETMTTSRRLIGIVWKVDKGLSVLSVLSTILPAILPFINAYIYKLLIDQVIFVIGGGALNTAQLYMLFGARIVTYFMQGAAFTGQDYVQRVLYTKLPIYLNQLILGKISHLDMQYFEESDFKDLLEKVRESYEYRPLNMISNLLYGLQSFLQVGLAFIAIAQLNLLLVILVALIAVPEFISQTKLSKVAWGIWGQNTPLRKRYWYLSGLLQDAWSVKEIKIFTLAKKFLQELRSIQEKFYQDNLKVARKTYGSNFLFNSLSSGVLISIEIFVIFEAFARRITVGDVGFYTSVVSNFQNGLGGLFRNVNDVYENGLYVKSIFEVLDLEPRITKSANPIVLDLQKPPLIEFKSVDFSYPDSSKQVFDNFSLTIEPGEKIALVGENGAGKSTIIKLLARFYDVDGGEILINGVNVKDLDLKNWYKHVGVLFQDFNRYSHTAKDNIHFGNIEKTQDLEQIRKAAVSSGANEFIEKFKKGYEQMLGKTFEQGEELSTGQWQKMALARAFFRNAPILVLDEPTASIDAKAEAGIFRRVEKLSKDKTVIIISHRFSTVRNADKIYVIDDGKIKEAGSHKELMSCNGKYARLFNIQAKAYQ